MINPINIINYTTVCSEKVTSRDEHVARLLAEGWVPYGSPYISVDSEWSDERHFQVMVKLKENKETIKNVS